MNFLMDRRRALRMPVTLLVQHQATSDGSFEVDYATNLSQSGVFIRTAKNVAQGSTLEVSFSPKKDARLIQASGRVARVTPDGLAVEFVRMDAESASLLRKALAN